MSSQSWDAVEDLLDAAGAAVYDHIYTGGDGVIPGGVIDYRYSGLILLSQNSNNHQQTWGVLGAAISALTDYMLAQKEQGYDPSFVDFMVYDGPNQVATANFGPSTVGGSDRLS